MSSQRQIDLRARCKEAGLANASQMSIAKMEEELATAAARSNGKPLIDIAATDKPTRKPRSEHVSVRTWLQETLASEGKVNIKAALEFAAATGRSKTTVYCQSKRIGLVAERGTDTAKDARCFIREADAKAAEIAQAA